VAEKMVFENVLSLETALTLLDNLIQPERLNTLQEVIFRECWQGKTYQEIAHNYNYDTNYIRASASRLWQFLSEALQEKVTKSNFHSILRQKQDRQRFAAVTLELPNKPVPAYSNFYIRRPSIENDCYQAISQPGMLMRLKASQKMGKTSLLNHILAANSSEYHAVKLDLQQADSSILGDFNKLIRWLAANFSSQLGLKNLFDGYWSENLGVKVSFTAYVEDYILKQLDKPLVLVIKRLQLIFPYTKVAQEFLPLLRFWYEEAMSYPIWQKLRLIVVQSTENYVSLNLNHSPFNVGLVITLPEFTPEQMFELAERHQLTSKQGFNEGDIEDLMNLIGGHPFLARLSFYNLAKYDRTLLDLIKQAATETSIYIDFLHQHLKSLYENSTLAKAFSKVILSDSPVQLEPFIGYQLESLGLISLQGNEAIPSCHLYRLYFQDLLHQF
jgi:hypothetical protein